MEKNELANIGKYRIGIDIGGSHISAGVVSEEGELLTKKPYSKDIAAIDFAAIINNMVEGIIYCINEQQISCEEIKHIGISAPGLHQNGKTITWGSAIQIFDTNTEEELRNALGEKSINCKKIDIQIANDVHCAAIAELEGGSLMGCKNAVCLTFGTGVGGGIIINGKLYTGENNLAGRLGHTIVDRTKETGKLGSFETLCSVKTLKQKISEKKDLETIISGEELVTLLENRDEITCKYFEEFKDYLYKGIESIIYILSPEKIAIGGSLAYLEEFFLKELRLKLSIHSLERNDTEIVIAKHKNDAGLIGAAMLDSAICNII